MNRYPKLVTMKPSTLVFIASFLVLTVFSSKVFSAPTNAELCPSCEGEQKDNTTLVCAQEKSGFQGSFANFCEMLRFNCINNRRYYVVNEGQRCKSDQAWIKVHNPGKA